MALMKYFSDHAKPFWFFKKIKIGSFSNTDAWILGAPLFLALLLKHGFHAHVVE